MIQISIKNHGHSFSDILLIKNCNEETVKESKTISSAYACILTRLKPKKQPTPAI